MYSLKIYARFLPPCSPILVSQQHYLEVFIDGVQRPVCKADLSSDWVRYYYVTIIVLFFFLPLALLIVLYSLIANVLLRTEPQLQKTGEKKYTNLGNSQKKACILLIFAFLNKKGVNFKIIRY